MGWMDQSKVYSQQGYVEKSLWISTYILIMNDSTVYKLGTMYGGVLVGGRRANEGD
jgi:hypothetical protein